MTSGPFLYFCSEWIWMGSGALEKIVPEAEKLGVKKALIITDPGVHKAGVSGKVKTVLESGGIETEIFSSVVPEPPFEIADECADVAGKFGADLLVGLGGGSSLDTTKGASIVMTNGGSVRDYFGIDMARKPGFPMFLIPTTAGTGSEVTRNAIFKDTKAKSKKAVVTRHILPNTAVVDPELMRTTPPKVTAFTGIDSLSHALESYLSRSANPFSEMYALETIRRVPEYLHRAVKDGNDMDARENMAFAALCGGVALIAGAGGIAATSYPVEGRFDVPHGLGNGIMMPYVLKYNASADIFKAGKIAECFGLETRDCSESRLIERLVSGVTDLILSVGLPVKLGEVGVKESDIPSLAEEVSQNRRLLDNNPRELDLDSIKEIYLQAI